MGFRNTERHVQNNRMYSVLRRMKPGDFFLVDNPTLVNKAIRGLSFGTYGHAVLYLGSISPRHHHQAMEMPFKLGWITDFLWHDNTRRIMGVHCHRLSNADRMKIVVTALEYAAAASRGKVHYDPSVVLQAMGTIVTAPIHSLAGRESSAAQGALAGATHMAENVADWFYAAGRVKAWMSNEKYLPNLSCAALITYLHWSAAGYRTLGRGSDPHYAQPKELETRVRSTPHHFKIAFEVKFGH